MSTSQSDGPMVPLIMSYHIASTSICDTIARLSALGSVEKDPKTGHASAVWVGTIVKWAMSGVITMMCIPRSGDRDVAV